MSARSTTILALLVTLLAGYIIFYERETVTTTEREARANRLLRGFIRDRVNRIDIQRAGETFSLVRDANDKVFELSTDKTVRADASAVETLLSTLEWTESQRRLRELKPGDVVRFGLAKPRLRLWFTIGKVRTSMAVGGLDAARTGVYVQLEHRDEAHVVNREFVDALSHPAFYFRSKQLVPEDVIRSMRAFTVRAAGGEHRLERDEKNWTVVKPLRARVSGQALEDLRDKLRRLLAVEFVDAKRAVALSSGSAATSIVIDLDERRVTYASFGRCRDRKAHVYFGAMHSDEVGCVLETAVASLSFSPLALVERRPFLIAEKDVDRVEFRSGDEQRVLRREDDAWRLVVTQGQRVMKSHLVDTVAAERWLAGTLRLRATSVRQGAGLPGSQHRGGSSLTFFDEHDRSLASLEAIVCSERECAGRRSQEPVDLVFGSQASTVLMPGLLFERPTQDAGPEAERLTPSHR